MKYRESKAPTVEAIHAIGYSRRLECLRLLATCLLDAGAAIDRGERDEIPRVENSDRGSDTRDRLQQKA